MNEPAEKKDGKYPTALFVLGFVSNVVFHYFPLFVPAIILLIVGIWSRTGLAIGLVLLCIDIVLSLREQLRIRDAVLHSDNPNFTPFQQAMLSRDWRTEFGKVMDDAAKKPPDPPDGDESGG